MIEHGATLRIEFAGRFLATDETAKKELIASRLSRGWCIGRELDFGLFVLGRLPGSYVLLDRMESNCGPQFLAVPSLVASPTEVLSR